MQNWQTWLEQRTARDEATGCLNWTKGLHTGYAYARFGRKTAPVTRMLWQRLKGEIPKGYFICHTCDNRRCVEITHLFLGTPNDNIQDMIQKGRHVFKGKPKTSLEKQLFVKQASLDRFSVQEITRLSGLSRSTIYRILNGTL